ncbi:MAG: septal ring lytic transglycosylase RlpA family protein [Treponema sp.]|jgi:rare lipoprotein A|nr:septal ring lytic transglycosylase RlpA family protein [Treponema sp.]
MKIFGFIAVCALAVTAFVPAQTGRPVSVPAGSFRQEGIASWYGAEFEGKPTASGEVFRASMLTAAHPTLPFGTMLKVTNKHNNKTVTVRINDRGPFVSARIIDLSRAAAQQLDMIKTGTAPVLVESVEPEKPLTMPEAGSVVQIQPGSARPLSASPPPAEIPPAVVQPVVAQPLVTQPATAQPAVSPTQAVFPVQPEFQPGPALLKGVVPAEDPAGNNLYRIQVGAYVQPKNAVDTFDKLKRAGLNPAYEKYNDFYRVVLAGIKSAEVPVVAEKLGQAGFREAIIKAEN